MEFPVSIRAPCESHSGVEWDAQVAEKGRGLSGAWLSLGLFYKKKKKNHSLPAALLFGPQASCQQDPWPGHSAQRPRGRTQNMSETEPVHTLPLALGHETTSHTSLLLLPILQTALAPPHVALCCGQSTFPMDGNDTGL